MLPTALGFPGDMRHSYVLALEVPGFSQGLHHHHLKAFCEIGYNGVILNIIKKYEVKMTRMLFKFVMYRSCERALKNRRVKLKLENRL